MFLLKVFRASAGFRAEGCWGLGSKALKGLVKGFSGCSVAVVMVIHSFYS